MHSSSLSVGQNYELSDGIVIMIKNEGCLSYLSDLICGFLILEGLFQSFILGLDGARVGFLRRLECLASDIFTHQPGVTTQDIHQAWPNEAKNDMYIL